MLKILTVFICRHTRIQKEAVDVERIGQTVLTYQFVVGLKPEIRFKIAGNEESFDQLLLLKARLEETKL